VVVHPTGERNYHIFYQLISAAIHDSSLSEQLNLAETSLDFRYAHRDDVDSVPNIKDFESFGEVRNAMNVSMSTAWQILSAALIDLA
jgi:myosin heavy subunit